MSAEISMNANRVVSSVNDITEILEKLEIKSNLIEHEEVFTVEAMMVHLEKCNGLVCKNLFVKDKKKKRLWLIVAKHDQVVSLNEVAKKVGAAGGFRFADESILKEKLGVTQGCVTPLAVCNDKDCDVTVILDSVLIANPDEIIYCHPMVNSASIGMKSADLMKFFNHTKHEPMVVSLDQ